MPPPARSQVAKGQQRSLMSLPRLDPQINISAGQVLDCCPTFQAGIRPLKAGVPTADSRSSLAEPNRVRDDLSLSRSSFAIDDRACRGADSSAIDSRLRRRETAVTASSPRRVE